jgi:membrane protease YdiL (CAAX protease family)
MANKYCKGGLPPGPAMAFRESMGHDNPWLLAAMTVAIAMIAKLWRDDLRAAVGGHPHPRAFPGATPVPLRVILVAVAGTGVLLAVETSGENLLGLSQQQSQMTVAFGVYTLAAAFAEELIFRGYLVVEGRGRAAWLAGVVGASIGFALLHPFLWEWKEGALRLHGGTKAWFSTALVFSNSLWFYAVRFMPANPRRSLLPCIAAHATKNLGVFAIKYAQGFVSGWW